MRLFLVLFLLSLSMSGCSSVRDVLTNVVETENTENNQNDDDSGDDDSSDDSDVSVSASADPNIDTLTANGQTYTLNYGTLDAYYYQTDVVFEGLDTVNADSEDGTVTLSDPDWPSDVTITIGFR